MAWIVFLIAAPPMLYGLHRYCLHLEERGYLYYRHKQPSGGGGSVFNPLQEITQPQIRHVLEIKDELPIKSEDDRGGPALLDVHADPATHLAPRRLRRNPETSA